MPKLTIGRVAAAGLLARLVDRRARHIHPPDNDRTQLVFPGRSTSYRCVLGNLNRTPNSVSLAEEYLAERGLPLSIAQVNGIEIDLHPDRAKIEGRLGVDCVPLWRCATEILW